MFLGLGTVAAIQAWIGWSRTERALRHGRPLPGLAVGAVIVIVAVALVTVGLFV